MRYINLNDVHEKKLHLFRRGGGEETTYEIRFAHYRNDHMWGYDTETFQAKAKSMKELEALLTEALAAVSSGYMKWAQDQVKIPEHLE